MRKALLRASAAALALCAGVSAALAQAPMTDAEKEIERYRAMISDPMSNPGFLAVDRGEALWATKRGAKNVSLETCDLGEGPGKLEGAYARLPRYFADADKVMDLEQRLIWCMTKIQELDTKDVIARRFSAPGRASDMEDLVAFIANKSSGMKIAVQLNQSSEREGDGGCRRGDLLSSRRCLGFLLRTCHADTGKRIRLQGLPTSPRRARRRRRPWAPGRPTASRRAPCARCSIGCGIVIASSAGQSPNMALMR